jgi:hypothetical protein
MAGKGVTWQMSGKGMSWRMVAVQTSCRLAALGRIWKMVAVQKVLAVQEACRLGILVLARQMASGLMTWQHQKTWLTHHLFVKQMPTRPSMIPVTWHQVEV